MKKNKLNSIKVHVVASSANSMIVAFFVMFYFCDSNPTFPLFIYLKKIK